MTTSVLRRRLRAAEARLSSRPPPAAPAIEWADAMCAERRDLRPLMERMAERAAEHILYGTPICYWASDLPEMWPLLEKFSEWFDGRFPGRWEELEVPFPERLPDGSWRSREAAPAGTGSSGPPRVRRRCAGKTGGAVA